MSVSGLDSCSSRLSVFFFLLGGLQRAKSIPVACLFVDSEGSHPMNRSSASLVRKGIAPLSVNISASYRVVVWPCSTNTRSDRVVTRVQARAFQRIRCHAHLFRPNFEQFFCFVRAERVHFTRTIVLGLSPCFLQIPRNEKRWSAKKIERCTTNHQSPPDMPEGRLMKRRANGGFLSRWSGSATLLAGSQEGEQLPATPPLRVFFFAVSSSVKDSILFPSDKEWSHSDTNIGGSTSSTQLSGLWIRIVS